MSLVGAEGLRWAEVTASSVLLEDNPAARKRPPLWLPHWCPQQGTWLYVMVYRPGKWHCYLAMVWREAGEGWWHWSQLLSCQNDQEGLEEAKSDQPACHSRRAEHFPALSCKELQKPTHKPTLARHWVVPTPLQLWCILRFQALLILEPVPLRWAKQVMGFILQQRPWQVVMSPGPPSWSPPCQPWVPFRSVSVSSSACFPTQGPLPQPGRLFCSLISSWGGCGRGREVRTRLC